MKVKLLKLIRRNIKISEYSHGFYDIQNRKHGFSGLGWYHNMEETLIVVHRNMRRIMSQYFILINLFLKKKHKSPKIKKSDLPKYYVDESTSNDTNEVLLKHDKNNKFDIWVDGLTHINGYFFEKNIYTNKELCEVVVNHVFQVCQRRFLTIEHTIKEIEKNLKIFNIKINKIK